MPGGRFAVITSAAAPAPADGLLSPASVQLTALCEGGRAGGWSLGSPRPSACLFLAATPRLRPPIGFPPSSCLPASCRTARASHPIGSFPALICMARRAPIGGRCLLNMQEAGHSASAGAGPPRAVAKLRLLNCYYSGQPIGGGDGDLSTFPAPARGKGGGCSGCRLARPPPCLPPPRRTATPHWRRGLPVACVSNVG